MGTHAHIHVHACVQVRTQARSHARARTYTHACTHAHTHMRTHTYTTHTCTHAHMSACTHTHTHTHTRTHTHTHTHAHIQTNKKHWCIFLLLVPFSLTLTNMRATFFKQRRNGIMCVSAFRQMSCSCTPASGTTEQTTACTWASVRQRKSTGLLSSMALAASCTTTSSRPFGLFTALLKM